MSRTPQYVWDLIAARRLREAKRIITDPDHILHDQIVRDLDVSAEWAAPDTHQTEGDPA